MVDGPLRQEQAQRLFSPEVVHLNTASYGLPPLPAWEAMQTALDEWRHGRTGFDDWNESVGASRAAWARLAGVDAADVAVGPQVSPFVGLVAASLPRGARVLCAEEDFTSVLFPWLAQDLQVDFAPLDRLADAVTSATDLVAVSAVQSRAEYMPYRDFFRAITSQVDLLERDFVPGHEVGVISVATDSGRTIRAGLGICFEVAIDHVLRDTIEAGADLLVIQTNNAMFDRSAESAQQLAISRVRAVEFGRSVVHSSNVGISALITPDGVAHQSTELFTPAIIAGELPLRTELTLATRLGPWPDIALAGAALLGLLLRRLHGRRATRGHESISVD